MSPLSELLNWSVVLGSPTCSWSEVRTPELRLRSHRHILWLIHGHEGTFVCKQHLRAASEPHTCPGESLTILLFTSSSIALTSSAALGVSELVGRTNNREEAYGRSEEKERGGGRGRPRVSHWTDSKFSCKLKLFLKVIPDKKTTSLSLFAFI